MLIHISALDNGIIDDFEVIRRHSDDRLQIPLDEDRYGDEGDKKNAASSSNSSPLCMRVRAWDGGCPVLDDGTIFEHIPDADIGCHVRV